MVLLCKQAITLACFEHGHQPAKSQAASSQQYWLRCSKRAQYRVFSWLELCERLILWCREAARRTRAKRMDTIASLSNEVQLLASMNQGLSMQLQGAVYQVCKWADMSSFGLYQLQTISKASLYKKPDK